MSKRFKTEQTEAFTLVELMVSVAIFVVIIGASYALMSSGKMSWHSGDTKVELQQDLRQAMDDIFFELSESSPIRVIVAAGGNSLTLQIPVDENANRAREDTDGDAVDDFYLENTLDGAGAVTWGGYLRGEDKTLNSAILGFGNRVGRQIRYIVAGDELRRQVLAGGAVIEDFMLANDIDNPAANPALPVVFTRVSNDVVEINLSARKIDMSQHPVEYRLTTAVFIKNRN